MGPSRVLLFPWQVEKLVRMLDDEIDHLERLSSDTQTTVFGPSINGLKIIKRHLNEATADA